MKPASRACPAEGKVLARSKNNLRCAAGSFQGTHEFFFARTRSRSPTSTILPTPCVSRKGALQLCILVSKCSLPRTCFAERSSTVLEFDQRFAQPKTKASVLLLELVQALLTRAGVPQGSLNFEQVDNLTQFLSVERSRCCLVQIFGEDLGSTVKLATAISNRASASNTICCRSSVKRSGSATALPSNHSKGKFSPVRDC